MYLHVRLLVGWPVRLSEFHSFFHFHAPIGKLVLPCPEVLKSEESNIYVPKVSLDSRECC